MSHVARRGENIAPPYLRFLLARDDHVTEKTLLSPDSGSILSTAERLCYTIGCLCHR